MLLRRAARPDWTLQSKPLQRTGIEIVWTAQAGDWMILFGVNCSPVPNLVSNMDLHHFTYNVTSRAGLGAVLHDFEHLAFQLNRTFSHSRRPDNFTWDLLKTAHFPFVVAIGKFKAARVHASRHLAGNSVHNKLARF